jgi:hypothetical protein
MSEHLASSMIFKRLCLRAVLKEEKVLRRFCVFHSPFEMQLGPLKSLWKLADIDLAGRPFEFPTELTSHPFRCGLYVKALSMSFEKRR